MTSITQATYKGIPVQLLDTFECGGLQLVVIRALVGRPFARGDKWPICCSETTVKASEIQVSSLPVLTGPQEPIDDPRIFNRRQPDGSYRPISQFFDREVDRES